MRWALWSMLAAAPAHAEPTVVTTAVTTTAEPADHDRANNSPGSTSSPHNLFYVELLGKAGAYGVGYERRISDRLSLGFAGSYADIREQQIATATPYLHARLLGRKHQLFTELGAVFVHTRIPSPVPEWDGMSDSGGGGFAALGWQHDWKHVVVRVHGSVVVGEGRATPWGGVAFGVKR